MSNDAFGSRSPISRRTFALGLMGAGLLTATGALAGCSPVGTPNAAPTRAAGVKDKGWKVVDQFYTLNNAYFQGWSGGSAQAAVQLALKRQQQVDEFSNDKVISIYEQAKASGADAISSMLADPGVSRTILKMAQSAGMVSVMGWNLSAWTTPFDFDRSFYSFITPNNVVGAKTLATLLFKKVGGQGDIIHITGVPGNSVDITRTVGFEQALKDFPGINVVASQPGQFDRGSTTPVIEALLTAHPDVKGVFCQNDDSAIAVINALKARGKKVPVTGVDAIPDFLDQMESDPEIAFATWAHHGAWMGGALMVRAYDALSGVKLSAPERMMFSHGFIVDTPKAAKAYNDLMYSGGTFPFDFSRMSKALHPNNWDPQMLMSPIEFESYFTLESPKPSDYQIAPAYATARQDGTFEKVAADYASHFSSDPFAKIRKLCANGGQEIS